MDSHEPVQVRWSNQCRKSEEKRLHEHSKYQLVVDVSDVVHQGWDQDTTDELTSATDCQHLVLTCGYRIHSPGGN